MYDVAWKRALMTPMLCLTFYRINSAKKKERKERRKTDGKRIAHRSPALGLLVRPILQQIPSRFEMYTRVIAAPPRRPRFVAAVTDGDEVERSWPVLPFCMYGSFRNGAAGSVKRLAVHASL